ncbi:uncharacterized protein LOC6561103 isoform X2 [Drosophila grimshawi]|nr:uncharacterized protein LOC6561103 isoform X2 [Drosophila grimshawi]
MLLLVPMSVIMRKRKENLRRLAMQRQRARQQMEISVTNNSTANTGNNCGNGNGNVCIQADNDINDIRILPKGMDLPPSYDDLSINSNVKQEGIMGASTLTIATDLECSNPNLAVAVNEPPPEYDPRFIGSAAPQSTTVSTTTVVSVTPRI